MSLMRSSVRLGVRAALCGAAALAGALTARYTDIARDDNVLTARAHAAPMPSTAPEATTTWRAKPNEPSRSALERAIAAAAPRPPETPFVSDALPAPTEDAMAKALRDGRIMTGATPHRLVLFTFDDGPSRFTTPLLLDRLDAAGVRAVFFLTASAMEGKNVAERKHRRIAREAVRRGHIMASHGMNHKQLPLLSDVDAMAEVVQAERIFEEVFGERPWLFRPPGGAHSPRTDRLVSRRGYTTMLWNLGAGDFQVRTAEDVHETWRAVLERREAQGERGGIILLHDTYAWSVDAFQLIVDDLLARNCDLVKQEGEELYDFADDPALFFQPREGANSSAETKPTVLDEAVLAWRQARLRADTLQRCAALEAKKRQR